MAEYEDQSPYPRVFEPTGQAYAGGVYLVKQDPVPVEGFAAIRRMIAHADTGCYYVGLEFYKHVPREYPPVHVGEKSVGIKLDLEEAAALWHSLGEFLLAQSEADERLRPGAL